MQEAVRRQRFRIIKIIRTTKHRGHSDKAEVYRHSGSAGWCRRLDRLGRGDRTKVLRPEQLCAHVPGGQIQRVRPWARERERSVGLTRRSCSLIVSCCWRDNLPMTVGSSAYGKLQVRVFAVCLTREIYKDRTSQLVKKRFQRSRPSPPTPGYEGVELAPLPQTPCALTFECGTSFTDAVHCVSNSTCGGEDVICLQVLLGTFSSSTGMASVAGRQPGEGAGGRFTCHIFFILLFVFHSSRPSTLRRMQRLPTFFGATRQRFR